MNTVDVLADVKSSMTQRKARRYSEPGRGRRIRCPEEILRDIRGLKLRQRVSLVLGDELLKDELEQTIRNSTVNGVTRADTIRTFQDFLIPQAQPNFVNIGGGIGSAGTGMVVLPVNDIKGNGTTSYNINERQLRSKLAAVYRLVDLLGWSESIYNHISVRLSNESNEYLINPFGLLFNEITASSLVKCDASGNVVDEGSTTLGLNKAGFVLHSTIHEFRPDLNCIIHVHTPDVIAVSSMKCGLLRISQESLVVGNVSYHDYKGILINEEERESIQNDLGTENKIMILRNHGAVICGASIESAFHDLLNFMDACETQVKAIPIGLDNLNIVSEEAFQQVQDIQRNNCKINVTAEGKPQMSLADLTFEAYMRWMDSQGYRTGYAYRVPDLFTSPQKKKIPASQIPPHMSPEQINPYQALYDLKGPSMSRGNTHRNRFKWLNNPVQSTQYKKEFIQKQQPQIEPPILDEEPPMTNGHIDEQVTTEVSTHNDTKVVTKTTTVTETQVITEISAGNKDAKKETITVVNGSTSSHSISPTEESRESVVQEAPQPKVEDKQPVAAASPTRNGSAPDISSPSHESVKSPSKVKKSKSFKNMFGKKKDKKEGK
ncbi:alpha-adducin-like [Clytia hemisphaerica]|uniref:alpha-adducin-like n=1 Tax=Clytia hemisphaerica TaxID=252671 RepID=UPI0034D4FB5A